MRRLSGMELDARTREFVAELLDRPVRNQPTPHRLHRVPAPAAHRGDSTTYARPTTTRHSTFQGNWNAGQRFVAKAPARSASLTAAMPMSGSDLQQRLDQASRELEAPPRREQAAAHAPRAHAADRRRFSEVRAQTGTPAPLAGTAPTSATEKIALVRRLFHGRDDVYARRWESLHTGKSGYAPATAEGLDPAGPKTYLPLDDEACRAPSARTRVDRHLPAAPRATAAGSSPATSMVRPGNSMRSALQTLRRAPVRGFRRPWSGAGRERAVMSGSSFPPRSPPRQLAGSARCLLHGDDPS